MHNKLFQPGKYYIGDPFYFFKNVEQLKFICDEVLEKNVNFIIINDLTFFIYKVKNTVIQDNYGEIYFIDYGCISCIPVSKELYSIMQKDTILQNRIEEMEKLYNINYLDLIQFGQIYDIQEEFEPKIDSSSNNDNLTLIFKKIKVYDKQVNLDKIYSEDLN